MTCLCQYSLLDGGCSAWEIKQEIPDTLRMRVALDSVPRMTAIVYMAFFN